jgi:hypothetical protein
VSQDAAPEPAQRMYERVWSGTVNAGNPR